MKWGKTEEQLKFEQEAARIIREQWRQHFALCPVKLQCGRTAWLETVETRQEHVSIFLGSVFKIPKTVYRSILDGERRDLADRLDKVSKRLQTLESDADRMRLALCEQALWHNTAAEALPKKGRDGALRDVHLQMAKAADIARTTTVGE